MATQVTLGSGVIDSASGLKLRTNGTTEAVDISTAQVATLAKDAVVNGLTVGRGAGAVATNTAVGNSALEDNTSGNQNTAVGISALANNTTGNSNSAFGRQALALTTTGGANTAVGVDALVSNTTASSNTAVGYQAAYSQQTGIDTTAVGYRALYTATGLRNTAIGKEALYSLTTGTNNTAIGESAGYSMTTGSKNTIIGSYSGNQGGLDIRTASNHCVLSDGDGNIKAYWNAAGTMYSIGVYNASGGGGSTVVVDSGGNIYRSTSSLKYKRDVQDSTHGLDKVLQLRSVTYKSKKESEGDKVFGGLIAEEVHNAGLTEFVLYTDAGEPDALQYAQMVSLAFKAIQELKAEVDSLKAQINGASA